MTYCTFEGVHEGQDWRVFAVDGDRATDIRDLLTSDIRWRMHPLRWGWGGGRDADCLACILLWVVTGDFAWACRHARIYAMEVISGLPAASWRMSETVVVAWAYVHGADVLCPPCVIL